MAQMKLIPSFRFDKYGYYIGETRSMMDPVTGRVFMPSDCVLFPPNGKHKDYRISADKKKWEPVTSVDDLSPVELIACADDTDDRSALIRARINSEVACDNRYLVLHDDENNCLYVKEAPDTAAIDALKQLKYRYLAALDRLRMNYYGASLIGDKELQQKYQDAYKQLADADTEEQIKSLLDKIEGLEEFVTEGEKVLERAIKSKQVMRVMRSTGFDAAVYRNQQYLRERRAYSKALGLDADDDLDIEG